MACLCDSCQNVEPRLQYVQHSLCRAVTDNCGGTANGLHRGGDPIDTFAHDKTRVALPQAMSLAQEYSLPQQLVSVLQCGQAGEIQKMAGS
jgi:hypothetical protein